MSTISGTPASSASVTAGWRFAAADPDVQRTAAGRPVASAVPSAKNAGAALVEDHRDLDRRAGARAPRPAASSASRGRPPPGARRSAPAPPPSPRRGRCCGWWDPSSNGLRLAAHPRINGRSVEAPRRKRVFVDLDAEAGAVADDQLVALGGEAVADRDRRTAARSPGRARLRHLRRSTAGPAPREPRRRSRPAPRERSRGRTGSPRAIPRAAPSPPTLATLTAASSQAPPARALGGHRRARPGSRPRRSSPQPASAGPPSARRCRPAAPPARSRGGRAPPAVRRRRRRSRLRWRRLGSRRPGRAPAAPSPPASRHPPGPP